MNTIQSTFDYFMSYRGLTPGGETARTCTEQVRTALERLSAMPAQNEAEQILNFAQEKVNKWVRVADARHQILEQTRSRMQRAVVLALSQDYLGAELDLDEVLDLLGDRTDHSDWEAQYIRATAFWMQGCLLHQTGRTSGGEDQLCWERALEIIGKLVTNPAADNFVYYSQLAASMRRLFAEFSAETLPEPIPVLQPEPSIQIIDSLLPVEVSAKLQAATLSPNGFFHLDVYPALAAGAFQPVWAQITRPVARVSLKEEIDALEIRRQLCRFYSLVPGKKMIRLQKSRGTSSRKQEYALFYITGDSMNKRGIDRGDYVLVRAQEDADPGDIVVLQAESAAGSDFELTLKLFERKTEEEWRFVPHSTNNTHKKYQYFPNTGDSKPQIIGIAIGLFKPQGAVKHGSSNR
ncbi:MAG TPA: S24 family peptidase [Anaerolineaceae bacterium]|jgi:hypothetical protein|nr:S24 family peptidase [Anaerolineaceae bacterium]